MAHKLIQIGNSKALIIPAKIIRAKKYDSKTEFDIIETADGLKIVQRHRSIESLEFPKVSDADISPKVRKLMGAVKFTHEEVEQDERLAYILSR